MSASDSVSIETVSTSNSNNFNSMQKLHIDPLIDFKIVSVCYTTYNTIQLYCLCVEKFSFWLVIYIKTFNKINNKTSTTQRNTELKTAQIQGKYPTITMLTSSDATASFFEENLFQIPRPAVYRQADPLTSTETIRLIRDTEPRKATSTFTQLYLGQ